MWSLWYNLSEEGKALKTPARAPLTALWAHSPACCPRDHPLAFWSLLGCFKSPTLASCFFVFNPNPVTGPRHKDGHSPGPRLHSKGRGGGWEDGGGQQLLAGESEGGSLLRAGSGRLRENREVRACVCKSAYNGKCDHSRNLSLDIPVLCSRAGLGAGT